MEILEDLKRALDTLVSRGDYTDLKLAVEALAAQPEGSFDGDLAVLNVLVKRARAQGVASLQRVWELTDRYHRKPKITPERKVNYQRSYMAERRARLRKAVQVYEQVRGPQTPDARATLKDAFQARWMLDRDAMLDSVGAVLGADKNELVRMFWEEVDALLGKALAGDQAAIDKVLSLVG